MLAGMPKKEWECAIASAYALNGDRDKAIEGLEQAYNDENIELMLEIRYPSFESIRSDPRYTNLMRRLNVPE